MKKFVFFVCMVLCSTGLIAMNNHVHYNIIELSNSDDDAMGFDEEESNSILERHTQGNVDRYETQEIIGQGEGPDALNPINQDSSNRSRAGSFTGQVVHHHQHILTLPFVMPVDNEDHQSIPVNEIGYHDTYYDDVDNDLFA